MASGRRKEMEALATSYGYTLKRSGNHLIWIHSITSKVVVTPKTASDRRALKNAESTLRKNAIISN